MSGEAQGHVVIVGAGHAGGSAAAFLRQFGWAGPITLVGEEPLPPYHRPPLSKAFLKRTATTGSLALRPAEFYPAQSIALRLNQRVVRLDRAARALTFADGATLAYDRLILALGATPRALPVPGAELAGVFALRGLADAEALRMVLRPGARLAIVGGGYIGLEVAASARALGAEAIVIEREPRLLARVASPALSEHMRAEHVARGVVLRLNATVAALEGEDRIAAVRLADGERIGCDAVLIGIGAAPALALATAAGLDCADGIRVDGAARTSDPLIHAIGDCTHRPLPLFDRTLRLESVPNAVEQARQAAADLCGTRAPAPEVPWFWSDQYDLRLQMAGLCAGAAQTIRREAGGGFALFHLAADDRLLAVEAVDAPAEFMAGRRLIGQARRLAPEALRDGARTIQQLAA